MRQLSLDDFVAMAPGLRRGYHANYYAMYSSVLDGIVTDPALMVVPVDDHLVHRGDGVFETCKCVAGGIYNVDAHLDRLDRSASALSLKGRCGREELTKIMVATLRAGHHADALIRILLSRGPGSLGVSPQDCPETQLYVVAYHLLPPFMTRKPSGASVASSKVNPKEATYARVKNCNYLQNVLMKREAECLGVDFVVGFDEQDCMTESATENIGIVTPAGALLFPALEGILSGTTMLRVAALSESLVEEGVISRIGFEPLPREQVRDAAEILVVGTTHDVASVVAFDGHPVGDARPGPVGLRMNALLQDDIHNNVAMRVEIGR